MKGHVTCWQTSDGNVSLMHRLFAGPECHRSVHHQPQRLRPHVLLFQPASGCLHLLATRMASWQTAVPALPADTLRPCSRVTLHSPGHHYQPLRHDWPPQTLPQVSTFWCSLSQTIIQLTCDWKCTTISTFWTRYLGSKHWFYFLRMYLASHVCK